MPKPLVYVHRAGSWYPLYMNEDNEQRLRSFARVASGGSREEPVPPEELVRDMAGAEVIVSLNGVGVLDITTEVLQQVGTVRAAFVSHWWGQHETARETWGAAGVEIFDVSDANSEAVAEWTVAAALMGVRHLVEFNRALKSGSPWGEPRRVYGMLAESVVGLVGLGRVGRHVARRLHAFGATVIVHDAYLSAEAALEAGVRLVPLEELLRTADVISVHLPVTDETRRLFGARELGWIRDGAVLINSARSVLFDPEALVAELKKSRFTALIDVFEQEDPLPADHPFRSMDNVFITPHVAGDTGPMFTRCGRTAIEAARRYLGGKS